MRALERSVIVLAGGRSQRLGHDKVLEMVGSRSLLEHVVGVVTPLGAEVIVVTGGDRPLPDCAEWPSVKVVRDLLPGRGPLVGIYTGLRASRFRLNIVVGADMPFLNRDLLEHMVSLASGFDIVTPRVDGKVEPLHSVYARDCLAPIELMLERGELSVYKLFPLVRVRYVDAAEIEKLDPQRRSFFNINTEADLRMAREILGGSAGDDQR